jgi:hypothetical protein
MVWRGGCVAAKLFCFPDRIVVARVQQVAPMECDVEVCVAVNNVSRLEKGSGVKCGCGGAVNASLDSRQESELGHMTRLDFDDIQS